jgi:hypothetical protein
VSVSIWVRLFFRFRYFQDLSVANIGAAGNAQEDENRGEHPSKPYPFIQIMAHKETKNDAAGHGQTQLHDNGQVFCPVPVFFVVEQKIFPCCCIDLLFHPPTNNWSAICFNKLKKTGFQKSDISIARNGTEPEWLP